MYVRMYGTIPYNSDNGDDNGHRDNLDNDGNISIPSSPEPHPFMQGRPT